MYQLTWSIMIWYNDMTQYDTIYCNTIWYDMNTCLCVCLCLCIHIQCLSFTICNIICTFWMCIWTQKLHQDQGLAVWLRPWVDLPCFWTACGCQHECVFRFAKNDPLETWSTEKSLWDLPSLPKLWEVHQMKRKNHFLKKPATNINKKDMWHVTCPLDGLPDWSSWSYWTTRHD